MADTGNMSGQAGGGSDSVFGGLGGGQQQGSDLPQMPDGPHNTLGNPNNNPSGGDGTVPAQDGVFGDLGGGVASQTGGGQIPNTPGRDPGGQGGSYG
jgi:hypothetical protein